MHTAGKLILHTLFQNRRVIAVACHEEELIPEAVKTLAEDTRVEKLVLTENIDCLIRYRRSCQEQSVFRRRTQPVHCLRSADIVRLDFVPLVGDDEVGLPCR